MAGMRNTTVAVLSVGVVAVLACGSRTGLTPPGADAGTVVDSGSDSASAAESGGSGSSSGGGPTIDAASPPECALPTLATLATGQTLPGPVALDSTYVYWAEGTAIPGQQLAGFSFAIDRMPKCGGPVVTLASGKGEVDWLGVDSARVYALLQPGPNGADDDIVTFPLAGGTATTLVERALDWPDDAIAGIAVNGDAVYWTETGNGTAGTVMVIPSAGGTAEALAVNQAQATGIAVVGGHAYWVDENCTDPRNGQEPGEEVGGVLVSVATGGGSFAWVANSAAGPLGTNGTTLFWSTLTEDPTTAALTAFVARMPAGGGVVSTIFTLPSPAVAFCPPAVPLAQTLWADSRYVYWANEGSAGFMNGGSTPSALIQIAVDGSAAATLASTEWIGGVATDGASVYWTDTSAGTVTRMATP
jgi:hypothetical protein